MIKSPKEIQALRAKREEIVRCHMYYESHNDVEGAIATFAPGRASYDIIPLKEFIPGDLTHPTEHHVRDILNELMTAFPDLDFCIEKMHHADDAVIIEGRIMGTHTGGPWSGIEPAGNRMDVRGAIFFRFDGEDMYNETVYTDRATLIKQLNARTDTPE